MIDLKPFIRDFILSSTIASALPKHRDTRRIFTRRPAPAADVGAAAYPMVLISNVITSAQRDLVDAPRRTHSHYLSVYGRTKEDLRSVEEIAHALALLYDRVVGHPIADGWRVFDTVSSAPTDAPTSDEALVGFMVRVDISFVKEG